MKLNIVPPGMALAIDIYVEYHWCLDTICRIGNMLFRHTIFQRSYKSVRHFFPQQSGLVSYGGSSCVRSGSSNLNALTHPHDAFSSLAWVLP